MKICWKCLHSQAIQDVDEFLSSSEQIWRNLALHHLLTNGSSAVNGCRQNESPNSWLKHHNNSQVIHTTPVHQLISCEVKRCAFVKNKSKFLQICSDEETNSSKSWITWGWVNIKQIFIFRRTIPLIINNRDTVYIFKIQFVVLTQERFKQNSNWKNAILMEIWRLTVALTVFAVAQPACHGYSEMKMLSRTHRKKLKLLYSTNTLVHFIAWIKWVNIPSGIFIHIK